MKAVEKKELHLIDVLPPHNAFSHGTEVETVVVDVYYFFKSAVQNASAQQEVLPLPSNVFLRRLSSRWLTLRPAPH